MVVYLKEAGFVDNKVEDTGVKYLEGYRRTATLRNGEERYTIRAGDHVGFAAGRCVGDCLVNESDAPFRFIIIGDRAERDLRLSRLHQGADTFAQRHPCATRSGSTIGSADCDFASARETVLVRRSCQSVLYVRRAVGSRPCLGAMA